MAVGDGFAFVIGGDDGFRVAVFEMLVGDDPAVGVAFPQQAEGFGIVVVVDFWFAVDGDEGVAVEEIVGVGGGLEVSCWCRVISDQ